MIPVTEFTISRSEWHRGQGPRNSRLLRTSDGKRCCVGIYARACGIPDQYLEDRSWPVMDSRFEEVSLDRSWVLPYNHFLFSFLNCSQESLARLNDDVEVSDREERITKWFWTRGGITVTFVD